ncbi:MAG: outer membrane protein transport protein [Patescibacteria group bacterium]
MRTVLSILIAGAFCLPATAGGVNRIDNSLGPNAGSMCGAYNAIADDASLFYYNPAGMSRFDSAYADFGVDLVLPKFKITTKGGSQKSDDGVFYLMPLLGFVAPINDWANWGIGITSPYGLGGKFSRDLKAGIVESEGMIGLVNVTPALSLKLNDKLCVGAGINIGWGQFKYKTPYDILNKFTPLMTDSEANGWGIGGIVGVMYRPTEKLTLGLTYMSESKINFIGFTKIGPTVLNFGDGFDSEFTFPPRIGAGIAWQATDRLTLAIDANWWGYSNTVNEMTLRFHDLPLKKKQNLDWRDDASIHLGARYRLNDYWTVNAGTGYMTKAIPDTTVSQLTPDTSGWGAALGAKYEKENFSFNFGATYGWGDREVKPGWGKRAPGKYEADIFTGSISASWKF